MSYDRFRAVVLCRLVNAAYGRGPSYAIPAELNQHVAAPIYGCDAKTSLGSIEVPYGFVSLSGDDAIVAIRGTATILEWVEDAKFVRRNCPVGIGNGETEDGFSEVYTSLTANGIRLLDFLRTLNARSITVTGHSLGAALATLLAFDIAVSGDPKLPRPTVYTFASPRVGDATFAGLYDQAVPETYRVANAWDLVPRLPVLGYHPVGQLIGIDSFPRVLAAPAHSLDTYQSLL